MKEKIYTIPVNDAYAAEGPCPLCALEQTLNQQLLAYYLGPSLMEPDVRMVTNAKGFCRNHLCQLYNQENNRLGLGLMLHTHLTDLVGKINPQLIRSVPAGQATLLRGRQKDFRQNLIQAAELVEARARSCIICERIESTMDRYLDVIFYEYFVNPEFKCRFDAGDGYCLPHVALLLRGAAKYLNQNQAAELVAALTKIQNRGLETLRDDVEWFTLKFDYRNHHKDWKNSKDALPRSIKRLCGQCDIK
jgi:hypothetical protein